MSHSKLRGVDDEKSGDNASRPVDGLQQNPMVAVVEVADCKHHVHSKSFKKVDDRAQANATSDCIQTVDDMHDIKQNTNCTAIN